VYPDARIKEADGVAFFNSLVSFQSALRQLRNEQCEQNGLNAFKYVSHLRGFVYDVRCNIFHGRKLLAEAQETDQNRRMRCIIVS